MRTDIKTMLVCGALVLPAVAFAQSAAAQSASAQSADVKYCTALADKYNDYAGHDDLARGRSRNPANVDVAIAKCKAGDVSGIAVLEEALKNARITLPPHA